MRRFARALIAEQIDQVERTLLARLAPYSMLYAMSSTAPGESRFLPHRFVDPVDDRYLVEHRRRAVELL